MTQPTRGPGSKPENPFSRADAEAVARKWAGGLILSPAGRIRRFAREIENALSVAYDKGSYPVLRQAKAYMEEKGVQKMEADIDPAIPEQMLCEYECGEHCWDEMWGIGQECFSLCLQSCNPYRAPEELIPEPTSALKDLPGFFDLGLNTKTSSSESSPSSDKSDQLASTEETSLPDSAERSG